MRNPRRPSRPLQRLGIACLCAAAACGASAQTAERLQVSENGRFLATESGRPFFYLGDTAWELFHRLDREEADHYLRNRAEKGFTVIQAVVLPQLGLDVPNALGDLALNDLDPEKPNEAYFRHVDWIVERAEELGLRIGMLPTWAATGGGSELKNRRSSTRTTPARLDCFSDGDTPRAPSYGYSAAM